MPRRTIQICPHSSYQPSALVDEGGWCHEHGWDCDDYGLYLQEIAADRED